MDESSLDPRLRDSGEEKSIVVNNGHQQVYEDHDYNTSSPLPPPPPSSSTSTSTSTSNRLAPNQPHDHYQHSPHPKEPQPPQQSQQQQQHSQQSHSHSQVTLPTPTPTSTSTRIPQAPPPSSSGHHNSIPTVSPNPSTAPPDSIEAQYHATSTPIASSVGGSAGGGAPIQPPVFTPHTPHTPTAVQDGGDTPGMSGEGAMPLDPNDPKRPRACEACRGLKVKCEPDPANPDGPCKRCAKAGRSCVVTQPTRKRQKKTDSRVAELEKKIDALTASLQASRGGGPGPSNGNDKGNSNNGNSNINVNTSANGDDSVNGRQPHPVDDRNAFTRFPTYGGNPNGWGPPRPQDNHSGYTTPLGGSSFAQPAGNAAGQKRKFSDTYTATPTSSDTQNVPASQFAYGAPYSFDPIDKGIITPELAEVLFSRYTKEMAPHLPAIVFPPSMNAATLRKTRPYLFLAIMATASSDMAHIQRQLANEVIHLIAEKIVIRGEKSVELVQFLLISVIWYYPPEHFEELKFYQFVHMAGVLAIDIGLGRKKNVTKPRFFPGGLRDGPPRRAVAPDPTTLESRRTWLSCYFLASNVAMALHRPNLIRWTPFMTECMDILESSPDAAPTDKYLCHLVWTHRLAEEVGIQFSLDDPNVSINITEAKVQYALRGFERDMAKYNDSISKEDKRPSLQLSFHVLNLYMHEIALHVDKGEDILRPPLATEALGEPIPGLSESLTAAHISALSACLTAIDGIFETFLSMDVRSIRCLPVFHFVRVAYTTVVLIKMYFSANSPDSELGKVIDKDNMKVEEYLDKLLDKFRAVSDGDRSRPASKFQLVLAMLRSWFQKQGQTAAPATPQQKTPQNPRGDGATGPKQDGSAPPPPPPPPSSGAPQNQQQSEYNPANTPLQLLSEIATGNNPSSRTKQNGGTPPPPPLTSSSCSMTGMSTGYQHHQHPQQQPPTFVAPSSLPQQQQQQQAAPLYDGSSAAMTGGMGQHLLTPWLGHGWSDLDFDDPGQGFEQAMGLTLQGLGAGLGIGVPEDWEAGIQGGWSSTTGFFQT